MSGLPPGFVAYYVRLALAVTAVFAVVLAATVAVLGATRPAGMVGLVIVLVGLVTALVGMGWAARRVTAAYDRAHPPRGDAADPPARADR